MQTVNYRLIQLTDDLLQFVVNHFSQLTGVKDELTDVVVQHPNSFTLINSNTFSHQQVTSQNALRKLYLTSAVDQLRRQTEALEVFSPQRFFKFDIWFSVGLLTFFSSYFCFRIIGVTGYGH